MDVDDCDLEQEELATDHEADEYFTELFGYDKWPGDVSVDFDRAMGLATLKSFRIDFAAAVQEYRALEAHFMPRLADDEANVVELQRHIAERILCSAHEKTAPFETCQKLWNELQQLGFSRIERRCNMTWFYADCCHKHGEVDIGLGVLEPLIAELEQLLADRAVTKQAAKYYRDELDNLGKLRAKLEALRT